MYDHATVNITLLSDKTEQDETTQNDGLPFLMASSLVAVDDEHVVKHAPTDEDDYSSVDFSDTVSSSSMNIDQDHDTVLPTSLPSSSSSSPSSNSLSASSTPNIPPAPDEKVNFHFLGQTLVILSTLAFSAVHASVRYLCERQGLSFLVVAFVRGLLQVTALTLILCFVGFRPMLARVCATPYAMSLLILRGVLGVLGICARYYTLSKLSVGTSSALCSTTPMFAMLIGCVFLHRSDQLKWCSYLSLALTTVGAISVGFSSSSSSSSSASSLVTGEINDSDSLLGVACGLLSSFFVAGVYSVIRRMGDDVHFLLSMLSFGLCSTVVPVVLEVVSLDVNEIGPNMNAFKASLGQLVQSREMVIAMGCVFVFAFVGALFLNRGVQLVTASQAAIIRMWDIPLNFVAGWIVLGEQPAGWTQLGGCALITLGVYVNART